MTILLKEQLKKLRRERGNTQEDLAAHLGVTVQAVSKWERGEGYPDINLLPAIASFYDVAIDDLLGVGQMEREKKIAEYRDRSSKLAHEGKTEERVKLWRKAKKEFPNDLSVMKWLMDALGIEDRSKNAEEIIEYGERILEESTDNVMRSGAVQSLCLTYYDAKGDAEAAMKYADMASVYAVTKNELMRHILEGNKAVEWCQSNIQELVDLIGWNTLTMCWKGEYDPKDTIRAYRFVIDLFDLLYPDGNAGFYHERYANYYERMAHEYKTLGDEAEMFRCLEKAAEHAIRFDTPEDGLYTAFMVNKVVMDKSGAKNYQENRSGLLLKQLQGKAYDRWREDERLLRITEKLRAVAVM